VNEFDTHVTSPVPPDRTFDDNATPDPSRILALTVGVFATLTLRGWDAIVTKGAPVIWQFTLPDIATVDEATPYLGFIAALKTVVKE